ncbi:MAG: MATE family efflux transporter [Candidatus Choladocola sp.]|nr:MATE family efflux transporter [Candidatus Choladocola sp.]
MERDNSFFRTVCAVAVPVSLQSMLQSSFGIVDQIMIGQLGSVSVAGVGLAGKFSSVFSVLVSAVGAVAGIMIAQYLGQKNRKEVERSFLVNLAVSLALAALFTVFCLLFPGKIMGVYTRDGRTLEAASDYLFRISGTFLPLAGATMLAALFRCMERASIPLFASLASAVFNTVFNYILIFGKCGFTPMGTAGAATATVLAQIINFLIMAVFFVREMKRNRGTVSRKSSHAVEGFGWHQYGCMLLPVFVCEMMWSIGENIYAGIYGRLGTEQMAAMTLINPVQGLMIGALCGLSQAAGVLIGKRLGSGQYDEAYEESKKLIFWGLAGSICLSGIILLLRSPYVAIYQVEEEVKLLTKQILISYAVIAPVKVLNMILGGGIIRSGGKTGYIMVIDLIGTWLFGVPLGMLAAFVLRLSIPYVYLILSLEECVRLAISVAVFRRKGWMRRL